MLNRKHLGTIGLIPFALLLYSCGSPSLVENCPSGFHGVAITGQYGFPATECVLNTDSQGAYSGAWSIPSTGQHGTLNLVLSQQGSDSGSITFADTNQTVSLTMLSVTAAPISSYHPPPSISFQYTYQGQLDVVQGTVSFSMSNHLTSINVTTGPYASTQPPSTPISFDLTGP